MADNAEALCLAPGTPDKGVQVDIQKFHTHAVNAVEIWIKIELTEVVHSEIDRFNLRNKMIVLIANWFKEHNMELQWALDVFFGPATGCLVYANSVQLTW
jgi:hypothetical protein